MKKLILGAILLLPLISFAQQSFAPSIIPLVNNRFYLGTTSPSTRQWLGLFTKAIQVGDLGGSGTRCVQTDNNGLLSVAGSACGSGSGGGGAGTWATTTSQTSSYLNYPLNATDVVIIGSTSATSSAKFYFDPNITLAKIVGSLWVTSSSTLGNFTFLNATGTSATTTSLNVSGAFSASSAVATSSITNALQIGGTARDNALAITAGRTYPTSQSVGGMVNFSNTSNDAGALTVYTNHGAGATAPLVKVRDDNTLYDQEMVTLQSISTSRTTLGVEGSSTAQGTIKASHHSDGTGNDGNVAVLSIDRVGINTAAQAIFIDSTAAGGSTGNALTVRNGGDGVNRTVITANGFVSVGSTTPFAPLTVQNIYGSTGNILFALASSTASTGATGDVKFQVTTAGQASTTNLVISGLGNGTSQCLHIDGSGVVTATGSDCGSGAGAVSSVTANDSTLTISPTTGAVLAALNLGQGNIWTAASTTFVNGVTLGTSTTTSATTTNFNTTNASTSRLYVSNSPSALLVTDSTGLVGKYGGASACSSNNFVTTISAIGGTTCGTATISGIGLGSNLNALTNGATLLGSSYNGSSAISDWDIDLSNQNVWTAASTTFVGLSVTRSTTTSATTTNFYSQIFNAVNASTSVLSTQTLLALSSSTLQNFTFVNATGTSATTSNFAIANIASGNCLHTTTGGAIVGTGSDCGAGGGGAGNSKFATSTNGLALSPNGGNTIALVLGGSATTTTGPLLEVLGQAFVSGSTTLQNFTFTTATGTSATTTNLNVSGALAVSSTVATSSITNALQIGGTARDSALTVTAGRVYPASVTTGGMVHIDNSTVNPGPALEVVSGFGSGATGRGIVFDETNTAFDQDFILASSSASNTTTFNIKGTPTGKGILKVEHTGNGASGFSNSSAISIDLLNAGDAQGIFIKGAASGTGKLINILSSASAALFSVDSSGNMIVAGNSTTTNATTTAIQTTTLGVGTDYLTDITGTGLSISSGALGLTNSTISGVALGSNLNALTNGTTLLGSSYNGSAAISDWDIDLANGNVWTAASTTFVNGLTIGRSTTTAATTTTVYVSGTTALATTSPWASVLSLGAPAGSLPLFAIGSTTSNGGTGLVASISYAPYASIAAGTSTANAEFAFQASTSATALFTNILDIASSTTGTAASSVFRITQAGLIYAPLTGSSGSSQTGYWCYDGSGQLIRDTAVCLVSALKFKKDVNNLDVGLADLLKLRPVSYYKKDPLDATDANRQMGFIADEVASSSPKLNEMLVTYDSDGGVHGFRYEQFTALITKSIQDFYGKFQKLVARVSGLEKKVDDQQKQIDHLQEEIDALKK